jgi:hypothetical protein
LFLHFLLVAFAFLLWCGFTVALTLMSLVLIRLLGRMLLTMVFLLLDMRLLTMALLLDVRLLTLTFLLLDMRLLAMTFLLLNLRLSTTVFELRTLGWVTMPLRLQPLDSPCLVTFPILVASPRVPVLLDLFVGHGRVVPGLASPLMLPVFMSPVLGHLAIERWDAGIVVPTPIVTLGAVPVPFPLTPPPSVNEKDVIVDVWHDIDISLRQDDHLRWG